MSIKEGILAEIAHETQNTKKILDKLTDEHWNYKPHEKSMTLGELASHIVELHKWVHIAVAKDVFNFHTDYQPRTEKTIESLKASLEENLQKNKDFVNRQTDEFWLTPWKLQAGDHVLAEMHKLGALRFIITNHLIHHRGQLTVYMRMLDIPLPGLYGPSADEK
jgi:uncharacterized damage-inducible protein DinB